MEKIYLILFTVFFIASAFSQQKPPVVENDYVNILAGDTIEVNVLLNDYCMEGHTMEIFFAAQGTGGVTTNTDSTITFSSYFYFEGIDSVKYIVQDLDNGLLSENGYLIVTIDNSGNGYLDINNVSALINAYGFQFCSHPDYDQWFEVPKGSGKNSIFCYTLWMGGLDENNELHLAAERYRQVGEDYWVGPVSAIYENQQIINWNKIRKLSRDEIKYHQSHWWESGYTPIDNIKNWPAHGNEMLGQADKLAPFIDWNDNGIYGTEKGDYPAVRGDQNIFFICNDDFSDHTESGGQKIGAEILGQAYAFDCPDDSVFNNSVFFHYDIINRSDTAYHDFYIGTYVDFDLGNAWDDFIGCDTLLQSLYVYNGDTLDEASVWGNSYYGEYPPAQSITYLNSDLSSFVGFSNSGGVTGDPYFTYEYYNNLSGLWKDGTPVTYGGTGYGGEIPTKYLYPGNPLNPEEWSEVSAGNTPNDRRGAGSLGPYDFNPGDTIQLDLAFVFARDYGGTNLSSVTLLKERIERIRWFYNNDSTPCGTPWSGQKEYPVQKKLLRVYPNPAYDKLFIDFESTQGKSGYFIYNFMGQLVQKGFINSNKTIRFANLKKGYYLLRVENGGNSLFSKFIKL